MPSDEFPDGNNDQHLCDDTLDGLFQAQATEMDFAARQEILQEIGQLMYEEVYWLGVWQDPDVWALSERMTNVSISGATPFYNVAEWDIE